MVGRNRSSEGRICEPKLVGIGERNERLIYGNLEAKRTTFLC
jgi:hypothetical protein